MKPKNRFDEDLDGLIKKALPDHLPPEVAAGMRGRIAEFQSGLAKNEFPITERIWIFRRRVWATLAILMLAAGCLLQGLRSPNPLAERIAEIKAGISSSEPARPVIPVEKEV